METYLWPLLDEQWQQNSDANRFERVAGGAGLRPDVLYGAKSRAASCSKTTCGFFPRAFKACPQCGETLTSLPLTANKWRPPFGGAVEVTPSIGTRMSRRRFGLPASADRTTERVPDQVFELPAAGEYAFVVDSFGAHASVVLAVNTLGGCYVSALSGDDSRAPWHALSTNIGSRRTSLTARQFALGLLPGERMKLLVPTDEGVGMLTPDLRNLTLDYQIVVGGRVAAGLAEIDGVGVMALLETAGGYCLRRIDFQGGLSDAIAEVSAAPPGQTFDAPLCYPLRGDIYWIGESGYFHASRVEKLGHAPKLAWHGWPQGWRAVNAGGCAHVGDSTASHIGDASIWQLGVNAASGYAYLPLGTAAPQPVDVPRMTSGSVVYHLSDRLHLNQAPWEAVEASSGPDKDDVIFPLMENASENHLLAVRVNRGNHESIRSLITTQDEHSVAVIFYDGQVESIWRTHMKQPWKTVAFIHAGSLFLHHPHATKLYRFGLAT